MGSTVHNMNLTLLLALFGNKPASGSAGARPRTPALPQTNLLSADRFISNAANQVLQMAVNKLMFAANQPIAIAFALRPTPGQANMQQFLEPPKPTQAEISRAVGQAGGREALDPWIVDGKTKLEINGSKAVVELNSVPESSGGARADAIRSVGRFGFTEDDLDGSLVDLRDRLRARANALMREDSRLAPAIEYALEDAYAKIHALENGPAAPAGRTYEEQRQTNLDQAASVGRQLGLGVDQMWGMNSTAEDLAVFGMDLTALRRDGKALIAELKRQSEEMLATLESRYVGTENEYLMEKNSITGALARLQAGLASAVDSQRLPTTGWSVEAALTMSTTVKVGGVELNASKVMSMVTVITDPLVFDLRGDGINLKSADDGIEFDMNGDGQRTGMGFIQGDNAFLFLDIHGDGLVHDGRQLFGNNGYANGFEMLRAHDSNGDGVIDENDEIFDKLMLWVEKNENGVCDEGETMTLREAGIKSISLGYDNVRLDDGKGNLVGQIGGFTRDDGSQGTVADVWLRERAAQDAMPNDVVSA